MASKPGAKRNYDPIKPTDLGVCTLVGYTCLSHADTKGEYADNKYKCQVVPEDPKLFAAFATRMKAKAKEWGVKPKLPVITSEGRSPEDSEDPAAGVRMKSKNKPMIVDSARNKLGADVAIYSGSKVRVAGSISNYDKGINLFVDAVQVIELSEAGARADASAFDEVEGGYTADTSAFNGDDADAPAAVSEDADDYSL